MRLRIRRTIGCAIRRTCAHRQIKRETLVKPLKKKKHKTLLVELVKTRHKVVFEFFFTIVKAVWFASA